MKILNEIQKTVENRIKEIRSSRTQLEELKSFIEIRRHFLLLSPKRRNKIKVVELDIVLKMINKLELEEQE